MSSLLSFRGELEQASYEVCWDPCVPDEKTRTPDFCSPSARTGEFI